MKNYNKKSQYETLKEKVIVCDSCVSDMIIKIKRNNGAKYI